MPPHSVKPVFLGSGPPLRGDRNDDLRKPVRGRRPPLPCAHHGRDAGRSVRGEAVEQPGPAGALERVLAAAAARRVRGVPGLCGLAYRSTPSGRCGPSSPRPPSRSSYSCRRSGLRFRRRRCRPAASRSGCRACSAYRHAIDDIALFGQRGLLVELLRGRGGRPRPWRSRRPWRSATARARSGRAH